MEKSSYQKTSFALAKRVLLLFFFLVFVPIALLTGLLLREEYVLRGNEKKITLAALMDEHQEVVKSFIKKEKQFLQTLFFVDAKYWRRSNFLKKWAHERQALEVFHLGSAYYGGYICDKSSRPKMVGKTREFFHHQLGNKRHFAAVMSPDHKQITFLQRDLKGGIWVETYAFEQWAELLTPLPHSPIQYDTFVAFKKGRGPFKASRSSQFETREYEGKTYDVATQSFTYLPFQVSYFLPKSFGIEQIPEFYHKLTIIVVVLFGVGVIIAFFVLPRFTKPFKRLFHMMQAAGKGHLDVRFEKKRFGFEVNEIGASFNEMMENLNYYIKKERKQRASKEQLKKELELGRKVQKSMLDSNIVKNKAYDASVFFRSAREVGGDFFDFFPIDDQADKVMCLVADTSGKGLDACLFALTMRSILRSYAKCNMSLSDLIMKANKIYLEDSSESQMFITAWVGIFDTKSGVLEYCNLGHNPPMYAKGETIKMLEPTGISFGVDTYQKVITEKLKVGKGDKLLLYTDGISEAMNSKGGQFGADTLEKHFTAQRAKTPKALVKVLMSKVDRFCAGAPLSDDQTLIVLEFLG